MHVPDGFLTDPASAVTAVEATASWGEALFMVAWPALAAAVVGFGGALLVSAHQRAAEREARVRVRR